MAIVGIKKAAYKRCFFYAWSIYAKAYGWLALVFVPGAFMPRPMDG